MTEYRRAFEPGGMFFFTLVTNQRRRFLCEPAARQWLKKAGQDGAVSCSRQHHRERGVWQRRFWEHVIRDEEDMIRHLDYIHYNPVKHGLVQCPHQWEYSSLNKWVGRKRRRCAKAHPTAFIVTMGRMGLGPSLWLFPFP